MNVLPRNPLAPRATKPDVTFGKRFHSINRGKALIPKTYSTNAQRNQGSGSPQNSESSTTSRSATTRDHGNLLRDTLVPSRQAYQTWLDNVRGEIDLVESAQQAHVRLLREARERTTNEEIERERRAIQQRLDAQEARVLAIALEKQALEEQRQRAAQQRVLEAEQRRAEEEAALEARDRLIAEEISRQQEEQEDAERQRRAREKECTVCLDIFDMTLMAQLGCEHWYCIEHIQEAFERAFDSRTPFQCCRQQVDINTQTQFLQRDFIDRYRFLILELGTPNALYCANRNCARFIPPDRIRGPDTAQCGQCNLNTCRHCRNLAHGDGECPADVETQRFRALAASRGWKPCPQCGKMVEKSSGCNHMTCTCRAHFCYRCGRSYDVCQGGC